MNLGKKNPNENSNPLEIKINLDRINKNGDNGISPESRRAPKKNDKQAIMRNFPLSWISLALVFKEAMPK